MVFRRTLVITATLLCHLLLWPHRVTSQVPHGTSTSGPSHTQTQPGMPPVAPVAPSPTAGLPRPSDNEEVILRAREQEKAGSVYTLRGDVEVLFRTYVLRADEITYDESTGQVTATGNLRLEGGPNGEQIQASRGEVNVRTQTGRFFNVTGTSGVRFEGRNTTLTTTDPFAFTGEIVEKTGPGTYVVHDGSLTSCRLPDPKWTFNASRLVVKAGDSAKIYNTTFRVKGIPVLYLPYAGYPVENIRRKSGFLIPVVGASSRKGTIIGESFYWAINRSMDATIGAEYYSSRGWAQIGEFRARPTEHSFINFNYFGVLDRGYGPNDIDQGGQDVKLSAEAQLPWGFRGVAGLNYLSSFVFRLAFTESFTEAVNSEVRSLAFVSRSRNGLAINAMAARYQNFQSTARGDLITIVHAPAVEISVFDRPIPKTPFYIGVDGSAEILSRREPLFVTADAVGRFDVRPRLSLAGFFRGWTLRPEIAMRNTLYTQRRLDTGGPGQPSGDPVNRRSIEGEFELRPPTLMRVFQKSIGGYRLKHAIEPRVTYRFTNGVDNFQNIIRFDARDILSDTHEVEYALVQRLYRRAEGGDAAAPQDFLTWEIAQKYFFDDDFGNALVAGRRNQLTTSALFTGIAFLTEPRLFSPIMSKLRLRATGNSEVQWQLDYDTKKGRINLSNVFAQYRIGDYFFGGSHAFLQAPGEIFVSNPVPGPERFNQFRLQAGYGSLSKRGFSTGASIGFDANIEFLQYAAFQNAYNWDCCGISMEYRRFALGSVRNENQFRFAFTLANIGTFGNLKRQERVF